MENMKNESQKKGTPDLKHVDQAKRLASSLKSGAKPEEIMDLIKLTEEYDEKKVPLLYGHHFGDVYIYSYKGEQAHQLHKKIIELYDAKLCGQINWKKEIGSRTPGDIGPVVAVANFIEDKDFRRFLNLFNLYVRSETLSNMREEGIYGPLLDALDKPITQEIHDTIHSNVNSEIRKRELKAWNTFSWYMTIKQAIFTI